MGRKKNGNTLCKEEGCSKPVHARGLCRSHYGKAWRGGDTKPKSVSLRQYVRSSGTPRAFAQDLMAQWQSLQRAWQRARASYDCVVGLEGRKRWGTELRAIRTKQGALERQMTPQQRAQLREAADGATPDRKLDETPDDGDDDWTDTVSMPNA